MSTQANAAETAAKNFYTVRRTIDFTADRIVRYDPLAANDRKSKLDWTAEAYSPDCGWFTLNLFGFSNLTGAFGITGTQAMRATPAHLNDTIKSIAMRRDVVTALAVGESNHVFTRDEAGIVTAANLMDKYDSRKYSNTKSVSLTLSREPFAPTGYDGDDHYIDGIVTANVSFGAVNFSTYTEILRQICSNGLTRTISKSSCKNRYSADWIPQAVEITKRNAVEIKNSVDALASSKVKDEEKFVESLRVSGLPAWVGDDAEILLKTAKSGDMAENVREEACPYGIATPWDYVNLWTYAMRRIKDLGAKQKLQTRLFNCIFRSLYINSLKEAAIIA